MDPAIEPSLVVQQSVQPLTEKGIENFRHDLNSLLQQCEQEVGGSEVGKGVRALGLLLAGVVKLLQYWNSGTRVCGICNHRDGGLILR